MCQLNPIDDAGDTMPYAHSDAIISGIEDDTIVYFSNFSGEQIKLIKRTIFKPKGV